jgi:hypothetical protein
MNTKELSGLESSLWGFTYHYEDLPSKVIIPSAHSLVITYFSTNHTRKIANAVDDLMR